MNTYAKFISETEIEYAPKNKGAIINYNLNEKLLLKDGYKPLVSEEIAETDRNYTVYYEETETEIIEKINYTETEDEYANRKNNEEIQLEIDLLNTYLTDTDLKRIRAICEPSVKDETTGETWLDYYTSQIVSYRTQINELKERLTTNDITE